MGSVYGNDMYLLFVSLVCCDVLVVLAVGLFRILCRIVFIKCVG